MSGLIFFGSQREDSLTGTAGDDTLFGGTDINDPQDASDTIYGASGNDILYGNGGRDLLFGGQGRDTIYGGLGSDTIYGGEGFSDITDGADYIIATFGEDIIYGNGGDDTIFAGASSDQIFGGLGNDVIYGGDDADNITDGNDQIIAGSGTDSVISGHGNDTITGGNAINDASDAADFILSGAGDDAVYGNGGDDYIDAGQGNDSIYSGLGSDAVYGGAGDDFIYANAGDTLSGGAGYDSFVLDLTGVGAQPLTITDYALGERLEVIVAESDSFTFDYQNGNGLFIINGTALLTLSNISQSEFETTLEARIGNVFEIPRQTAPLPDVPMSFTLTSSNDNFIGASENDTFTGAYADLAISGDTLTGGGGIDQLVINAGVATLNSASFTTITGIEQFHLNSNGAHNISLEDAYFTTLDSNQITITTTSTTAITVSALSVTNAANSVNITGSSASDVLTGGAGNDILSGGSLQDSLRGGAGADTLTGGLNFDRYRYFNNTESGIGAGNRDVITDFTAGDRIDLGQFLGGFTFRSGGAGAANFSGSVMQVAYQQISGNTIVFVDSTADNITDFEIQLNGLYTLVGSDFIL